MRAFLLGITVLAFSTASGWADCAYHSAETEKKQPDQTAMSQPAELPQQSTPAEEDQAG